MSAEIFSRFWRDIEKQRVALSTFATRTDISQSDKAILLKAEYYLLRLSRMLYVNKIDSARLRIRESQNAFPDLQGKTKSLSLNIQYEGIIKLLAMMQSELVSISVDKNDDR